MIKALKLATAAFVILQAGAAAAQNDHLLPTGQTLTPLAMTSATYMPLRTAM